MTLLTILLLLLVPAAAPAEEGVFANELSFDRHYEKADRMYRIVQDIEVPQWWKANATMRQSRLIPGPSNWLSAITYGPKISA